MNKEYIISNIKESSTNITKAKNIMGCSENWYNPFYCIGKTFSMQEINNMSTQELNNLYKLADKISSALY